MFFPSLSKTNKGDCYSCMTDLVRTNDCQNWVIAQMVYKFVLFVLLLKTHRLFVKREQKSKSSPGRKITAATITVLLQQVYLIIYKMKTPTPIYEPGLTPQHKTERCTKCACTHCELCGLDSTLSDSSSEANGDESLTADSEMDRKVELTEYRHKHLAWNKIHLVHRDEALPESQVALAEHICRQDRASPDPTMEGLGAPSHGLPKRLALVYEADVMQNFFAIFTDEKSSNAAGMFCSKGLPINKRHVPENPEAPPDSKLSQPKPDLLYGYYEDAFEQGNGTNFHPTLVVDAVANNACLVLPFLTVEFKGQWPASAGNLCVAENQAAGSSSACVKMAEYLNDCLEKQRGSSPATTRLDTAAFSIVTNGTEARLFMTWKEHPDIFRMKHLRSFCLAEQDQRLSLRNAFHNILDWGYNERLDGIRRCLRILLHINVTGRRGREDEYDGEHDEHDEHDEHGEGRPCKRQKSSI